MTFKYNIEKFMRESNAVEGEYELMMQYNSKGRVVGSRNYGTHGATGKRCSC